MALLTLPVISGPPSIAAGGGRASRRRLGDVDNAADRRRARPATVAARATPGESGNSGNSENGENKSKGVDWDSEWSSYRQQPPNKQQQRPRIRRVGEPPLNSRGAGGLGGLFSAGRANGGRNGGNGGGGGSGGPRPPPLDPVQADLRRSERLLLDVWASPGFAGAGAGIALVVLLGVLFGSGPLPADDRCTLAWCSGAAAKNAAAAEDALSAAEAARAAGVMPRSGRSAPLPVPGRAVAAAVAVEQAPALRGGGGAAV